MEAKARVAAGLEVAGAPHPGSPPVRLVLASASASRRSLLDAAGIAFAVCPSAVDESEIKTSMRADGADASATAHALAALKARRISEREPESFVVGADQLLDCDGTWFDKPADRAAARAQLLHLRGRSHELATAAVVMRGGAEIWSHVERPRLTMRSFSDPFLDGYLDGAGDAVRETVGGYRVEDSGAQLFERIDGDWFAILGLPLLPLLAFLRSHGLITS